MKSGKLTAVNWIVGIICGSLLVLYLLWRTAMMWWFYLSFYHHGCVVPDLAMKACAKKDLNRALKLADFYEKEMDARGAREFRSLAYEVKEKYEEALEALDDPLAKDNPSVKDDPYAKEKLYVFARLHYKLGEKDRAFKEYCEGVKYNIELSARSRPLAADDNPKIAAEALESLLLSVEHNVLCDSDKRKGVLVSPFDSFRQFVDFMDEEYAKLEKPEEYSDVMELIHRSAGDASRSAGGDAAAQNDPAPEQTSGSAEDAQNAPAPPAEENPGNE